MPVPTTIHTLLSGNVVEWARIEFKTTWDPEASLKAITAFANDLDNWGGGYIVLGVKEDNGISVKPYEGVPLGKVDAWQKDIFEKCKLIRPGYTLIKSYLKEIGSERYATADGMSFEELCSNMNLISTLPEYVKPKNVALMFFNSEPEKFFPSAGV